MKTFILAANGDEARHVKSLESDTCQVIITGEGRTNVIKTLAEKLKDGTISGDYQIVNVGYVGGGSFHVGDVVKIGRVSHFIPSTTIKEREIYINCSSTELPQTECFTADNFVDADSIGPWMPYNFVCDMELYYISLMFPEVISFKIVSDELNYDDYKNVSLKYFEKKKLFDDAWEKVRNELKEII